MRSLLIGFALTLFTCNLVATSISTKQEMAIGRSIAARLCGIYGFYDQPQALNYLNLVGHAVAHHNGRQDIDYHFGILDTPLKRAFATPGGYILISKGLIDSLSSESELAAIIAHEMAHINEFHVIDQLERKQAGQGNIVNQFLSSRHQGLSSLVSQLSDHGVQILMEEGLQHSDEFEADLAALFYLNNTGYSPQALKGVLEQLKTVDLSATHPATLDRIQAIDPYLEGVFLKGHHLSDRFQSSWLSTQE